MEIVPTPVPTCRYCETYLEDIVHVTLILIRKNNTILSFYTKALLFVYFTLILRENRSLHITSQVF